MNKFVFAAATAAACAATQTASAGGCNGPACQQPYSSGGGGIFHKLFVKQPLPAFQAAPWYLYWPYNAHFMTPAPLMGAYYAPPPAGGLVNPYFPSAPGYYPGGGQ